MDVDDISTSDEDAGLLLQAEAQRCEQRWYDMGFREGVLRGKLDASQGAFDRGYHKGAIEAFLATLERTDALPDSVKERLLRERERASVVGRFEMKE